MLLLLVTIIATLFVGCGNGDEATSGDAANNADDTKSFDKLVVYFVPSREPEEIIAATEPLKTLLKDELTKEGYDFNEIDIQVGTSYEAVGEALTAGTADVGFIPGGTYVLYDDGAEVILTATRAGLSKDSDNPKDWNDGKATEPTTNQVTYYRSLLVAGSSEKGQALLEKVNKGEELTLEDIQGVNWGVQSSSSSAGYIYPTLWLQENYDISMTDLDNVVQVDGYGSSMARLASGQLDVCTIYADARRDYEENWTTEYGRTSSIWEETGVIGVTPGIYNDTISVSKTSEIMDEELIDALKTAFISIGETAEGKEVIAIYSHEGYMEAKSSDYDTQRDAQEIIKEME